MPNEEKTETANNVPYHVLEHAYKIQKLEARLAKLDKLLRDAQLVLYGIALGLILAEIARL